MSRVWMVAARDFNATVRQRGFIIGLLLMPVLMTLILAIGPRIAHSRSPQVQGDVAVIDRSNAVLGELRTALDPGSIAARRAASQRQPTSSGGSGTPIPMLSLIERPANAAVQNEKSWLIESGPEHPRHLALVVIPASAVTRDSGAADYGPYELYVSKVLNEATESVIQDAVSQALVAARLKTQGLDRADIEAVMRVPRPGSVVVAAAGEQAAYRGLRRLLPFLFGILLFIGVMAGGQGLMTSMIEEKSSRVVEVLLAAVSPLELMWGKLIAQLGVGLLMLSVYVGLGVVALIQFATMGVLEPMLLVDLALFFLVAYLIYGALMLTVGAAVNQLADAQSLMGPIMLLLIAPYVLTTMIGQAPNSALSVTLSFVPPINTFVMLARLASDTPPPAWQVALSLLAGLTFAAMVLWFAAKVFRIGLLMHGKPPNIATLIRWARMA